MNMKVLQISNYFYPNFGGIEQVARDFSRALKYYDVEQKIICFNETARAGEYENKRNETVHEYVEDVEVIRCGCITKVASQSIAPSYWRELKFVLDTFDPDLVVFHYPNPFVAAFLLGYVKRRFKMVIYWHLDITKQKILGKLFHGQNKTLIKWADKIIGATPKHVNESAYSRFFGNKKYILPYQIDEKRLALSDEEVKKAGDIKKKYGGKTICFFIGRHVPYKGLKYLIEASALIANDDLHFIVAGSGELTSSLKDQAKGDDKVEFVGRISDSEWRTYLYACDIFCFPSITRNEAFGLAQAEAMYYKKPVVTFTIPGSGVNYVNLDGITGIECPNCNSKAYAEALVKLTENPELRLQYGENGYKRVIENFSEEAFVKNVGKLIKLYH